MSCSTAFVAASPASFSTGTAATSFNRSSTVSLKRRSTFIAQQAQAKLNHNGRRSLRQNGAIQMAEEMPEEAKKAVARGENVQYWAGEWICVDCGFIYKPARKIKFEDLPGSWKCPQCNAPKRRFAKKAGDFIQENPNTSNLPIIIFSIGGLILTVLFGVWASTQL